MSNIINYMMQDLYINNKAYIIAKSEKQLNDYRISYEEFLKYNYVENYLNLIDCNITMQLLNVLSKENIKRYFYLCLTLNSDLNSEDIDSLLLDLDFFNYNLIILNSLIYLQQKTKE